MTAPPMAKKTGESKMAVVAVVLPQDIPAALNANIGVCFLAVIYMAVSAGLISFNKWLMHEERFPYSVCMGSLHMAMSSACCLVLFLLKPGLFPALSEPESSLRVDRRLMLSGVLPIAVTFSLSICLSNTAYLFAGVAFLQMLKEANVVLIYSMSLLVALERFSLPNAANILAIILATMLTVKGEVHFVLMGFLVQFSAMVFECSKIVLQALLLSPQGRKLDPLSYCALVTPVCFAVLSFAVVVLSKLAPNIIEVPPWHVFAQWWPYLLINSAHAFILNVITAIFIKNASAVSFILTGIVKDAAIVLSGCIFLGDAISSQQFAGFTLQLVLVALYSLRKVGSTPQSRNPSQSGKSGVTAAEAQEEREPLLGKEDAEEDHDDESTEAESQGNQCVASDTCSWEGDASDASSDGTRSRKESPHAAELV